jgi:hypothetical protein
MRHATNAALPMMAPNKQVGEQTNGLDSVSTRRRGTGWVQLNGEPLARAGWPITIIGARPGVDGSARRGACRRCRVRAICRRTFAISSYIRSTTWCMEVSAAISPT